MVSTCEICEIARINSQKRLKGLRPVLDHCGSYYWLSLLYIAVICSWRGNIMPTIERALEMYPNFLAGEKEMILTALEAPAWGYSRTAEADFIFWSSDFRQLGAPDGPLSGRLLNILKYLQGQLSSQAELDAKQISAMRVGGKGTFNSLNNTDSSPKVREYTLALQVTRKVWVVIDENKEASMLKVDVPNWAQLAQHSKIPTTVQVDNSVCAYSLTLTLSIMQLPSPLFNLRNTSTRTTFQVSAAAHHKQAQDLINGFMVRRWLLQMHKPCKQ